MKHTDPDKCHETPGQVQGACFYDKRLGIKPNLFVRLRRTRSWIKTVFSKSNVLYGLTIYAIGDSIAQLILGHFDWMRTAGMMAVGASIYAWEIPAWFSFIDRRTDNIVPNMIRILARTGLALLYFNPLWIARHLFFIILFSEGFGAVSWGLLQTALISWLVNIPVSIIGNVIIQGLLPLRWRFVGSATFSALMAIYYALSGVWFHAGS